MKSMVAYAPAAVLCIVLLVLPSCSARYAVVVDGDGSARVDLSASVGARTSALIANLAGLPSGSSTPIADAAAVSRALASEPGVASASLANTDPRSISGTLAISRPDLFLSPRFVRVEAGKTGGKVTVSFDRVSAPEVLGSLSPDIGDYLSALMAPVATGEKMGGREYLELVSSVYGSGVAGEIRDGRIVVVLTLPGVAAAALGGAVSGNTASFSLPLLDFLTLERPVLLEASWR